MTIFFHARRALLCAGLTATTMMAGAADVGGGARDLFAFAAGGRIVAAPDFPEMSAMHASPLNLIDGSANTDWEGEAGEIQFVIELAEQTELDRLSFDTAGLNRDTKGAKDFTVEVSDTSADSGFAPVMSGTLKLARNGQSFAFDPQQRPVARWVRLTISSNYGDDYTAITGFHGFGRQLTQSAAMPALTGKYDGASGWGRVNISESPDGVSGCYAYQQGEFRGVVDGRVLKLDMVERASGTRMTGLFQMMPGDQKLVGIVRNEGAAHRDAYANYYSAERESETPNGC